MTVASCGGCRDNDVMTGVALRFVYDSPFASFDTVASYVCEYHLLTLDGYHNVGYKIPTDQLIHMYPYLYKFS